MRFLCHTAHTPHLTIVTDFYHCRHIILILKFSFRISLRKNSHHMKIQCPLCRSLYFQSGMPHSYGSAVSGLLCRQAFRARKHTARLPRWDRNLPAQGNGCGTEKGRLTGWRAVKGERKSRKKCRGGRTTEVSAHPPVFRRNRRGGQAPPCGIARRPFERGKDWGARMLFQQMR